MLNTSDGVINLELIRDQKGGAREVDFKDLSNEELRARFLTFPQAKEEFQRRFFAGEIEVSSSR